MKKYQLILFALTLSGIPAGAQEPTNYDESKVPAYTLPELLVSQQGKVVSSAGDWMEIRRPEILRLFQENMYGRVPGDLQIALGKTEEQSDDALGGKAIRKQVVLHFHRNNRDLDIHVLMYLPKRSGKVPVFLGYNFFGNQTVIDDPAVSITQSWVANDSAFGISDHRATANTRGIRYERWQVRKIIDAGYGLVTAYYGDVAPDKNDFSDGVFPLLYKPGQEKPLPDEWGAISAWAWGLSRIMDYLEKDPDVDASKVAVMGHSRLGKTALWAGAQDQRFALVISNNSGCGGAALSRREYGERLGGMNQYFPYWLCDNCNQYDGKEETLPVDQHMLIALIAPRPVYIASAVDDRWADPKGEYLSGFYASPVYKLFGETGLTSPEQPPVSHPVMQTIGYHIRPGGHGVYAYDWDQFIRFANLHFGTDHQDTGASAENICLFTDSSWVSPDREKRFTYGLNIHSPWKDGGVLFMHFPEHLEYNPVGNTILRHYDSIPTPWVITPDHKQATYRVTSPALPQVIVESSVMVMPDHTFPFEGSVVKLSMHIINHSAIVLPVIRPLICMQYKGLTGFPGILQSNFEHNFILMNDTLTALSALSTANPKTTFKGCVVKGCPQRDTRSEQSGGLITRDMDLALSMVDAMDGNRKVIFWWTPGKSMIANANIPCLHADPYFGTLKPGQDGYAEGMIVFTDGDPQKIIAYLKSRDKRVF